MKIYDYNGSSNIISERLKIARVKNNLSQRQLAEKMNTHQITMNQKVISRIENGERFVADFELLAFSRILDVSLYWLFGIDNYVHSVMPES